MPMSKMSATCEFSRVLYCETLRKKNMAGYSYKRRGMLTYGVVLLHDNARPHTAARTRALLEHFNWELFATLLTALTSLRAIPPVYLAEELVGMTALQQ
jgi:hypothetical protein